MKTYFAEIMLDNGKIRVEFDGPESMDDDDAFDRAVAEVEKQLKYSKLDWWGEA